MVAPQDLSYHCNRVQKLNVTEIIPTHNDAGAIPAIMSLSKVQWQAFHSTEKDKFDYARDCDAIDTPDIVPIVVGCALAALVVVVLLGYLVGRRRANVRGDYLSM